MAAPRKLAYASKSPARGRVEELPSTERKVPIVLLIVGLLLRVGSGFMYVKQGDLGLYMMIVGVLLVVVTVVRVGAAFIAASLIGTSFGEVKSAILKFAGIFTFVGGIEAMLPFRGVGLITGIVALGLLVWLFEIETYEAVIFSIISWVIGIVVTLAVLSMFQ